MRPERPTDINVVIYHADCPDGFGAAFAAWTVLGDDAAYLPVRYGESPPEIGYTNSVAILDFSYPRDILEKMILSAKQLILIDHHASARDRLADINETHFDTTKSGAMLAWEYFHPGEKPPILFEYIQDKDLWQWNLPNSREFSAGLETIRKNFIEYQNLCRPKRIQEIIEVGKQIQQHINLKVNRDLRRCLRYKFMGHSIGVLNTPFYHSDVGAALAKTCDIGVVWHYDYSLNCTKFSLRSAEPDKNVAEIAHLFGGGGHPMAAGFSVPGPVTDIRNVLKEDDQ